MTDRTAGARRTRAELADVLRRASVEPDVFGLRPDYRVLLVAVDGIVPGGSDAGSERVLRDAESEARDTLARGPAEELPHVAAWRDAYRAFGAKPQRTRNSLEALLRRVDAGLPRINRITDVYNAMSIRHLVPIGGEDLDRYAGAPRLARATGTEPFVTSVNGEAVVEHADAGEVVWCDDDGITCRRWNWRQTTRTALREDTTAALFVLDALAPFDDDALARTAQDLLAALDSTSPDLVVAQRLVDASSDGSDAER